MRRWWRWTVRPAFYARIERLQTWCAWHTPRWLAYWCAVRVGVHAASGPSWTHQIVPELTVGDALHRWR